MRMCTCFVCMESIPVLLPGQNTSGNRCEKHLEIVTLGRGAIFFTHNEAANAKFLNIFLVIILSRTVREGAEFFQSVWSAKNGMLSKHGEWSNQRAVWGSAQRLKSISTSILRHLEREDLGRTVGCSRQEVDTHTSTANQEARCADQLISGGDRPHVSGRLILQTTSQPMLGSPKISSSVSQCSEHPHLAHV